MYIRNYILFIIIACFSMPLQAQEFITLDWQKTSEYYIGNSLIKSDIPGFKDAYHFPDSIPLPYFTYQFNLGNDYSIYDYDVRIEYPEFQIISKREAVAIDKVVDALPAYPIINTSFGISANEGLLRVNFIPIVYREDKFQRIKSFKLTLLKKKSLIKSFSSTRTVLKPADNSVLSSGKWVKVKVKDTGVYQITNSELQNMGFSNPANVRLYGYGGNILPEEISKVEIDDLQEMPLWRENGYVLFYANGTVRWQRTSGKFTHTQNYYSTYGCYFLTESDGAMSFPVVTSLPEAGAQTITTFPDYALYEKEEYSWANYGRELYENYDYRTGNTKSYTFTLPGITEGDASVVVKYAAASTAVSMSVKLNGTECGTFSPASGRTEDVFFGNMREFTWNGDKREQSTVTLVYSGNVSARLDYIRLNYSRRLALYNSYTAFRSATSGKIKFSIANANENTRVWNVSRAAEYKQMDGALSNGVYSFISDCTLEDEYVVVNVKGSFNKVEVVGNVPNQNLHALKDVDMVIIVPPVSGLIAQAQRLAEAHRKKDGMSVQVVTSIQVYNEFSSGTPDATAYRRLMKMLYDRAKIGTSSLPKYLLLFGDAMWDNRFLTFKSGTYNQDNFLLAYESVHSFGDVYSVATDDYFGLLDDSEGAILNASLIDIGIGRFPVQTTTQAKQVVDKTIAYMENNQAGNWKNKICVLGDDGTEDDHDVYIHMRQANELAELIESEYPDYLVDKIYWDAYPRETSATGNSYPEVRKKILEVLNRGALIVNYAGHGNPNGISHEWVLRTSDVKALRSPRLPVYFFAACDITTFDSPSENFGEQLLLNPKGGAIAVVASPRSVFPDPNSRLHKAFVSRLLSEDNGKRLRLGDALRLAKCDMKSSDVNHLNFMMIGDPALEIALPPSCKLVIDEMNGKPADEESTLKAGSMVTIKGRTVNAEGQTMTDFNGTVYPTILDNVEEVKTLDNSKEGFPFVYNDRSKTVFAGSDSVRSGNFSFTFPVPLDINYSYKHGLVNLYAIDNEKIREGQGGFTNFIMGGTADGALESDSLGPKINLYLNTPDFVYGGQVNETPYLVAELEDEDGINAVGNGVGHDLMAVIDNSPVYAYSLNNYYESALSDYTRGTVRYSLPELPEGKHQLLFRAWDIKNNSSTAVLDFEVVKGLQPNLFSVSCTKSPARESTTFIISHNRPESEIDVSMYVYDFTGQILWRYDEKGISLDNYYYIDWDLTTGSGQRIDPGIYLFKAAISCDGSKESTKAQKIVVLEQ